MIKKFKEIQITKLDIDLSERGNMNRCAIARASKREIDVNGGLEQGCIVEVHSGMIDVMDIDREGYDLSVKLDTKICDWIEEYDAEELGLDPTSLKPFTIKLDWKGDFNADGKYIV
jgi:hypothetical protein